ncbi:Methylthioribose-1-phosphate isomerase [Hypsibius exemplaris]|uniref:Methylthioribose-1-phosphate isomerase n=1 Tax=Hypsibius exemplaris TaxID=2072580 RepID=A0A9X6RK02_HYPEX|nr:Methylthioribose-1-phosphate isomerase [Hypsibius exemplaris]
MALEAIRYREGQLSILDQLLLPSQTIYIPILNTQHGYEVIKSMQVRGAPAIAIVGCLSLAVELKSLTFPSIDALVDFCRTKLEYLVSSRPTAVNIRKAADHLLAFLQSFQLGQPEGTAQAVESVKLKLIEEIEKMLENDVADNVAIGDHGAADILARTGKTRITVLTHCNTGSLATAGYGTALGVVRSLQKQNQLEHVYFNETRPYCQGSRLTAYEIVTDKLPGTLICDSASGWLMQSGKVDCVITGADRVVANGDTANKIGTYMLAVLAYHHNIPFYIAAPVTTCDLTISSGKDIVIEERDPREVTNLQGQELSPKGTVCWNPAFDITPAHLITGGIITERGVFKPSQLKAKLTA